VVIIFLFFGYVSHIQSQNILVDGNLGSDTSWTVYHALPAHSTYEFNYTIAAPKYGKNGCLRLTSAVKSNTLFWQKISLVAGKKYIADGAVKTNGLDSFLCEYYLSTEAPIDGADYSSSSNAVLGLSTWKGCGPNLDTLMSAAACAGTKSYTCPGTAGTKVDAYFAMKVVTDDSTLASEVLMDEVSVSLFNDSTLLSATNGIIDPAAFKITWINPTITVDAFKSGLTAASTATFEVLGLLGHNVIPNQQSTIVSDTMVVKVVGTNGTSIYSLKLRPLESMNDILSAVAGTIDTTNAKILDFPTNVTVVQFRTSLVVSKYATFKVLYINGLVPTDRVIVNGNIKVEVTSKLGTKKTYTIVPGTIPMPIDTITDSTGTFSIIKNKILRIEGNSVIHITNAKNPLPGTVLNLISTNCWVYFDSIRPVAFRDKFLTQILVNGAAPVANVQMRLVQYLNGCVLISQASSYKPLEIFAGENLTGRSMTLSILTYYKTAQLGTMNDSTKSFVLKKGYMATFAQTDVGGGYSKVYIADKNDVIINKLPIGLYGSVSFIRVMPWRWVTKKGWCGGDKDGAGRSASDTLNCSWRYNWDSEGVSGGTLNVEYIPMRKKTWIPFEDINGATNTTHVLSFNEPDQANQADMTVAEAIAQYPRFLESGLRLGSPAPTDGGPASWLFPFIKKCDSLNYRVDFVAVHMYQACRTASTFYSWLKWIHDETKRPIWVTEWNNGANWTDASCFPDYATNAARIADFIYMMDTTSFVERYSVYNWVGDTRKMFYTDYVTLTPAGIKYRDKVSPMAFNSAAAYSPAYFMETLPPVNPSPADKITGIGLDTVLTWANGSPKVPVINYKVYFGTTNPPTTLVAQSPETKYDPGTLLPYKIYYWKVIAETMFGEKAGPVWRFLTSPVSVDEVNTMDNIGVSPNPVSETLNITGIQTNETAEIYNIMGTKVFSGVVNQAIDVSYLPKGMYILKIKGYNPINFIKE
jgi:hypothetical protein